MTNIQHLQDIARQLVSMSLACGRPTSSLLAELETELALNGDYYKRNDK